MYGVKQGVTISSVTGGGPAEKAGLQAEDTITSVNGHPVKSGDDLVSTISAIKPGTKVPVAYVRNGQQKEGSVVVGDRAKLFAERSPDATDDQNDQSQPAPTKLGMTVKGVTPETAERFGIPEGQGVQVTDVRPDSFADDIGVQPGMIILKVNKQPVNSEADFRKATAQLKSGQDVVFLVKSGRGAAGGNIFLSGTLP
jgi:serine protease Do